MTIKMRKSNTIAFSQALGFIALTCMGSACVDSQMENK